jgi:hypothetical protein
MWGGFAGDCPHQLEPANAEAAKACEIQTRQNGGHLIDCECIVCLEWKAAVQSLQNIIDRQAEQIKALRTAIICLDLL